MSGQAIRRGTFIVFEGLDRAGKTTQVRRLVESLNKKGYACETIRFPDRGTHIGALIDGYLRRKIEVDDHAIHLLFTANRWEKRSQIQAWLDEGKHVICDRYSASGIAYSASKLGLDIDWCISSEEGLLDPDLLVYLTLSAEEASRRAGYGDERYENDGFQTRVRQIYAEVQSRQADRWTEVNADGAEDSVAQCVWDIVEGKIKSAKDT